MFTLTFFFLFYRTDLMAYARLGLHSDSQDTGKGVSTPLHSLVSSSSPEEFRKGHSRTAAMGQVHAWVRSWEQNLCFSVPSTTMFLSVPDAA